MSKPARKLVSARGLARELGQTHPTILRWYRAGEFDAEIHMGKSIRFDVEKVKATLAKRAKRNRGEEAARIPTGMVPTY